jgi:hypothetical protein
MVNSITDPREEKNKYINVFFVFLPVRLWSNYVRISHDKDDYCYQLSFKRRIPLKLDKQPCGGVLFWYRLRLPPRRLELYMGCGIESRHGIGW